MDKYVDSGKVTETGAVIYHRQTGAKGRPARYTLTEAGEYVKYTTPKANPVTPVVTVAA